MRCSKCGIPISPLRQRCFACAPDPSEPPPELNGSVIGYRAFRIRQWQLGGTATNRIWEPGVNKASCDRGPAEVGDSIAALAASFTVFQNAFGQRHDAPGENCHCGLNAMARFTSDDTWTGDLIYGAIEAWREDTAAEPGDVADAAGVLAQEPKSPGFILHENGFRARYAKVVLLAVDDDWPAAKKAAVRALAHEHEADVCAREHLEDAAKEHGQLVPDEMLVWARDVVGVGDDLGLGAKAKKIKQTLGHPGPPGFGKHKRYDRVRDSRGQVWQCTKDGKPGSWKAE